MKRVEVTYDIAVIGAGPAGLSAAIVAARQGRRVILLEKNGFLGGNATLGLPWLGFLDLAGRRIVGGIAQEYVNRLTERGQCLGHRTCPKHNSTTNIDPEGFKILAIEMCQEAGVEILLHTEAREVIIENGSVASVVLFGKGNEITVNADLFIDCTGDGDVAYLAGCSYESGQKGTGVLQPPTLMFTMENVDTEALFAHIEKHPEEMTYGEQVEVRSGYDAQYFRASLNHVFVGMRATFMRLYEKGELPVSRDTLIYIKSLKPGEVYVNTTRILAVDTTDIFDLTKAELEGHLQIAKLAETLKLHVPGFKDAFISTIAPNLGVRETRRFAGVGRLVGEDLVQGKIDEQTIGLGGYKIDIHSGTDVSTIFTAVEEPFGIPYLSLVSSELDNLMFAGRCASMDAIALGSVRVMPQCMTMGEAAGLAASMALEEGIMPADVDVAALRDGLLDQGAILTMQQVLTAPINVG